MEKITQSPGLQHIAETIFLQLDLNDIEKCQDVAVSWQKILRYPMFWFRKCVSRGFLKKHKSAWSRAISLITTIQVGKNADPDKRTMAINCITSHLKEIFQNGIFADVSPIHRAAMTGDLILIEFLAPLMENPNAPDENGWTPIHAAASVGLLECVLILEQFTENPDVPNPFGVDP